MPTRRIPIDQGRISTRRMTPAYAVEIHAGLVREARKHSIQQQLSQGLEPIFRTQNRIYKDAPEGILELIRNSFADAVAAGETLFVKTETSRLVTYAGDRFEDDARFELEACPLKEGVVFFEEPIPFVELDHPRGGLLQALTDGFVFSDITPDDETERICHAYFFLVRYTGDEVGLIRSISPLLATNRMPLADHSFDDVEADYRQRGYVSYNPKPFLQALWTLMGQPIVSESTVRPIDPDARKARKHLAGKGDVRVLRLRQRAGGDGPPRRGHPAPEWTHRWIVRGFWRMQRCGTGGRERKRIWVDQYVKGPADKPLLLGPRVYKE